MQKYSIYKPKYKKLIDLKINLHYREKILKFQKKKWQKYKYQLLRLSNKKIQEIVTINFMISIRLIFLDFRTSFLIVTNKL